MSKSREMENSLPFGYYNIKHLVRMGYNDEQIYQLVNNKLINETNISIFHDFINKARQELNLLN